MASLVVLQHKQQPSLTIPLSCLSEFSGIRQNTTIQYKRKLWVPKEALHVRASSNKKFLIMAGTRFIGVFLSRLLAKEGHQVTLLTRGQAPITQQLPRESYKDYEDFSSKLHFEQILSSWWVPSSTRGKAPITQQLPSASYKDYEDFSSKTKAFAVPRRNVMALILASYIMLQADWHDVAFAQQPVEFREYVDAFDGYSFKYPQNWIQVRGAGADIFFRDPFILDENLSVEVSSPSSSRYKSVEDLGSSQEAGEKVLRQYLTEFMSTRLGVKRESSILSTSSRVADDGRKYYQVEVNIKSYANDNELAVMPQDRIVRLEWDRRYLSVLGVENSRLYELRLQTPERVFVDEENDLRQVMDSFRVNKVVK